MTSNDEPPSSTAMYAVQHGDYGGSYLVLCREDPEYKYFYRLPEKKVLKVPVNDYTQGIEKKILDFVANLPEEMHNYCKELFNNEENNNI